MVKEKLLHKSSIAERAVSLILSISNEGIKHLKIDDIAEALKINKKFLPLIFKREQKNSIPAFIRREKLHRALFILQKEHSITIPEISKILFIDKNFFLDYIFRQGGKKISLMDDLFYCGLLRKYN